MQSLDLARPGRADARVNRRTAELNRALRSTYALDTLVIPWSESLRVVGEGDVGWVFGPEEMDPNRTRDGRCVIPAQQRKQLRIIARTGLPVQRIAVAHQVPPVQMSYPEPRSCTPQEARQLIGPVPPHPRLAWTVRKLDAVVGGGLAAAGSAVRAAGILLDPIIFGVVAPTQPQEDEPAVWIPLVAWRW